MPAASAPSPQAVDAAKRKTSRISLDAVMGSEGDGGAKSSGPKTIKLKRPGEGGPTRINTQAKTVRAIPKAGGAAASPAAAPVTSPDDDAESTPTQKRTVVVKRTGVKTAGRKLSVARENDAEKGESNLSGPAPILEARVEEPSAFFAITGIAAFLVIGVTVYLMASQMIGPNNSGTQYSAWRNGPNLSWPGKLAPQR